MTDKTCGGCWYLGNRGPNPWGDPSGLCYRLVIPKNEAAAACPLHRPGRGTDARHLEMLRRFRERVLAGEPEEGAVALKAARANP